MTINSTIVSDIFSNVVKPFLQTAYDVLSLIGGIAVWLLIVMGVVKVVESKLGPTGWSRASALTGLFEHFKWFILGVTCFYVTTYVIVYIMSYMGANVNPQEVAVRLLLDMFFKPFTVLYKSILQH